MILTIQEWILAYPHIAYIAGFLTTIIGGEYFTNKIVTRMWDFLFIKHYKNDSKLTRYPSQPAIVGLIERTLYFASFLANLPTFIALWLTLKTVAKSPRWTNDNNQDDVSEHQEHLVLPGRAIFQPFIAGNGLSILFAIGGYGITYMLLENTESSIYSAFGITLGLLLVSGWAIRIANQAVELEENNKIQSID